MHPGSPGSATLSRQQSQGRPSWQAWPSEVRLGGCGQEAVLLLSWRRLPQNSQIFKNNSGGFAGFCFKDFFPFAQSSVAAGKGQGSWHRYEWVVGTAWEGCVQGGQGSTLARVMPGAAVRLPEPDWGQMGKLNICRPVLQPAVTVRQPGWTDGQKAGSSLSAPRGLGLARGRGG